MKKVHISSELAYVIGIFNIALGTALMEKGDFGMSMIVAPAYLLYRKLSLSFHFMTFGIAEYMFQAFLLILLSLVLRKWKPYYLFSFCTALFYGFLLDGCMKAIQIIPVFGTISHFFMYLIGFAFCGLGVAFVFHTYLAPEVYELFVKEVSYQCKQPLAKIKTIYDCSSLIVALVLSFVFFGFGQFVGIKAGTILCAFVNGKLISLFCKALDAKVEFTDRLPLRCHFE